MTSDDADVVLAIYAEGVASGNATFECHPPDWAKFDAARLQVPRLVVEDESGVCGWAVLSAVSARQVYAGVAEVTLYIAERAKGQGLGARLLAALVDASEAAGIWMLQAVVFPENTASIRLHERAGFRQVGRRERIALMECGPYAGRWRDTLLLERRSAVAG
jgi:L-amino acid N-acyltransferase YncA